MYVCKGVANTFKLRKNKKQKQKQQPQHENNGCFAADHLIQINPAARTTTGQPGGPSGDHDLHPNYWTSEAETCSNAKGEDSKS